MATETGGNRTPSAWFHPSTLARYYRRPGTTEGQVLQKARYYKRPGTTEGQVLQKTLALVAICIWMRLLAAKFRKWDFYSPISISGTILVILYLMVWDL